jgi:hypothetical protein
VPGRIFENDEQRRKVDRRIWAFSQDPKNRDARNFVSWELLKQDPMFAKLPFTRSQLHDRFKTLWKAKKK